MSLVLGFDVYGTLVDTDSVRQRLAELMGDLAGVFAARWGEKQLEYSFRRGLMQNYADFSLCRRQALDYCCELMAQPLTEAERESLMAVYQSLPAFDEVPEVLAQLAAQGHRLFAFSNDSAAAVAALLERAGIAEYFEEVVSAEEQRSFKPNPAVYSYFVRRAAAQGRQCWLISGNAFDVIGAASAGLQTAWVQRSSDTVFDPWGIEPTVTLLALDQLPAALIESQFK